MYYYNNNLVQCKNKCGYICNKNDLYDKLTNNIYYQNNFCNTCIKNR